MVAEEILGALPEEWEYVSLGEACARSGGGVQTGPFGTQLHASDYVVEGIPSIMPQNIGENRVIEDGIARINSENAERLSRYLVRTGDIVYSRRGDVERRALIRQREEGWLCGTGCLRVRFGSNGVDPVYASHYLGHPAVREWILRHAHGATMANLNTGMLSRLPFVIPPLAEQRAIADVLERLDEKIELNRRMNETLESMAQAIFKSWFVDFDPVRSKAADQIPPDLDPEIAALFPDRFEQSDLGEIPAGWDRIAISELAEVNTWTLGKSDELDRIEYIEISEVSRGNIGSIKLFERGEEPSRARRRLRHGDTVMSTVRPDRGSYFLCLHPSPYLIASTGFSVITPTGAPWSFVHTAITRPDVFEHLGQQADGAAYPAISPEIIGKWHVTWPDQSAIVEAFHKLCSPPYELAEKNRRQSRILAALRDALLPKLLSGEIRFEGNSAWQKADQLQKV